MHTRHILALCVLAFSGLESVPASAQTYDDFVGLWNVTKAEEDPDHTGHIIECDSKNPSMNVCRSVFGIFKAPSGDFYLKVARGLVARPAVWSGKLTTGMALGKLVMERTFDWHGTAHRVCIHLAPGVRPELRFAHDSFTCEDILSESHKGAIHATN